MFTMFTEGINQERRGVIFFHILTYNVIIFATREVAPLVAIKKNANVSHFNVGLT